MNKVNFSIAIIAIIAIFSLTLHNRSDVSKNVRTVRFHYMGEIKKNINLKCVDSIYIEDSTVKKIDGGIICNSKMSAMVSFVLLKSIYKNESDLKLPIAVTLINGNTWHNRSWIPKGADGGAGEILLCRQNSEILFYCHYK